MSLVSDLLQLQNIDAELETRNSALAHANDQLSRPDGLDEARDELTTARQRLREFESTEKDLELKDEELTSHLADMEKKLYSGRVNNPKELSGLNDDVTMLKRNRRELDERVLNLMEEVEAARTAAATADSELKHAEAAWQQRQQKMQSDRADLTARLADLNGARQESASALPASALGQYESTRSRRRLPVASIERNACSGCRVEVPTLVQKAARNQQVLTFCTSCNRILYVS